MPSADHAHNLCNSQDWQTSLLATPSVWPICPDCWAVMQGSSTPTAVLEINHDKALPEAPTTAWKAERIDNKELT